MPFSGFSGFLSRDRNLELIIELCIGIISESSNLIGRVVLYMTLHYMALSHKDWKLPNLRISLAESDIDLGLDFPI